MDFGQMMATLRKALPDLQENYRVNTLDAFGSYVRTEQTPDSDLDVLVTFSETPSLLKFIEMEIYLSDLLGVKVDLVMKHALKPLLEERILDEAIPV